MRKEIKWISTSQELPAKGLNVDLYGDNWRSSGWLTESGLWSIAHTKNVTILSKPTHWAYIEQPKSKPGQPRKDNPKVRVTFRLDADIVLEIRKQPNQAKYIEGLVTKQLKVNS